MTSLYGPVTPSILVVVLVLTSGGGVRASLTENFTGSCAPWCTTGEPAVETSPGHWSCDCPTLSTVGYSDAAAASVATSVSETCDPTCHAPYRLVDGNTDTNLVNEGCAQTEENPSPWFLLDLSSVYDVISVTLTNVDDVSCANCSQTQAELEIRVGRDGSTFSNNALCHHQVSPLPEGATVEILCDTMVTGRYLSIQRVGVAPLYSHADVSMAPLRLCEVQALAAQDARGCQEHTNGGCGDLCVQGTCLWHCDCYSEGTQLQDNCYTCLDVDECVDGSPGCTDVCINQQGSYTCLDVCPVGFMWDSDEEKCVDIDECARGGSGCAQTCVNTHGSYHCICAEYFKLGDDSVSCEDINECETYNGGCSDTCRNLSPGHECACSSGYELDQNGFGCVDIDECLDGSLCQYQCLNTPGGYECVNFCSTGYSYEQADNQCVDIDECATNNGGCESTCHNVPGSVYCACPDGQEVAQNGFSCQDYDECSRWNGGCSHQCHNTDDGYYCACDRGFQLESAGFQCEDMNECTLGSDRCSQTCVNTLGSYSCECGEGFTMQADGKTCLDINECSESNGGCEFQCNNEPGYHTCVCPVGRVHDPITHKCADSNKVMVYISFDHEWDNALNNTESALSQILTRAMLEQGVYPTEYLSENGYRTLGVSFRPGSVQVELSFDFYYAQDIVEQTKITWGLAQVLTERNSSIIVDGEEWPMKGVPTLSSSTTDVQQAAITDVCYLFRTVNYCKEGSECYEKFRDTPACKCELNFAGPNCDNRVVKPIRSLELILIIILVVLFILWCILAYIVYLLWRRYRRPQQILVTRVSPEHPPPYQERVSTPEFLKNLSPSPSPTPEPVQAEAVEIEEKDDFGSVILSRAPVKMEYRE